MKISGRVTFQDFEGGFWGIISGGGDKFVPVEGIPEIYRIEGLSVDADVEPVSVISTSMWGKHVKLIAIGNSRR